jgi:hypothetical protein
VNCVSVEALRYAAQMLAATEAVGERVRCECGTEASYVAPDGTRVSAGGCIEAPPRWFCRRHLGLELGEPVAEQAIFRQGEAPAED